MITTRMLISGAHSDIFLKQFCIILCAITLFGVPAFAQSTPTPTPSPTLYECTGTCAEDVCIEFAPPINGTGNCDILSKPCKRCSCDVIGPQLICEPVSVVRYNNTHGICLPYYFDTFACHVKIETPSPSPPPSQSPTPSPIETPSPSPTESPSPTPSPSPTGSPSPTPSPSPSSNPDPFDSEGISLVIDQWSTFSGGMGRSSNSYIYVDRLPGNNVVGYDYTVYMNGIGHLHSQMASGAYLHMCSTSPEGACLISGTYTVTLPNGKVLSATTIVPPPAPYTDTGSNTETRSICSDAGPDLVSEPYDASCKTVGF